MSSRTIRNPDEMDRLLISIQDLPLPARVRFHPAVDHNGGVPGAEEFRPVLPAGADPNPGQARARAGNEGRRLAPFRFERPVSRAPSRYPGGSSAGLHSSGRGYSRGRAPAIGGALGVSQERVGGGPVPGMGWRWRHDARSRGARAPDLEAESAPDRQAGAPPVPESAGAASSPRALHDRRDAEARGAGPRDRRTAASTGGDELPVPCGRTPDRRGDLESAGSVRGVSPRFRSRRREEGDEGAPPRHPPKAATDDRTAGRGTTSRPLGRVPGAGRRHELERAPSARPSTRVPRWRRILALAAPVLRGRSPEDRESPREPDREDAPSRARASHRRPLEGGLTAVLSGHSAERHPPRDLSSHSMVSGSGGGDQAPAWWGFGRSLGWNSLSPVCQRQKAYMFAKSRKATFLSSVKWPLS